MRAPLAVGIIQRPGKPHDVPKPNCIAGKGFGQRSRLSIEIEGRDSRFRVWELGIWGRGHHPTYPESLISGSIKGIYLKWL